MMLTVILLSTLMIINSTQSVIRHLICDNYESWLFNLNLTLETLQIWAGSCLLVSKLEEFNLFHLTGPIALVLLM